MARKEHTEKPINKGKVLNSTNRPMMILMGTAISVDIKPVMAAAIPAI